MKFLGESVATSGSTCSAPMVLRPVAFAWCVEKECLSGERRPIVPGGDFLWSRTARSHDWVIALAAAMATGCDCLDIHVDLFQEEMEPQPCLPPVLADAPGPPETFILNPGVPAAIWDPNPFTPRGHHLSTSPT